MAEPIEEAPPGTAQASEAPPTSANQRDGVVEVFCGVGGLSHGFVLEGFEVRAGVDVDPACRYPFERNNHSVFLERDVAELSGEEVGGLFAEAERKILVGCAPCQPFSTYSHNRSNGQWKLLREFGRLVREVSPDIVSMENVPRLTTFQGGRTIYGLYWRTGRQRLCARLARHRRLRRFRRAADAPAPRGAGIANRPHPIALASASGTRSSQRARCHRSPAAHRRRRTGCSRPAAQVEPPFSDESGPNPGFETGQVMAGMGLRSRRRLSSKTVRPLVWQCLRAHVVG